MTRYKMLRRCLSENIRIINAIVRHAVGGPAPIIPGFPVGAQRILDSEQGRNVSKEFAPNVQGLIERLETHRKTEAREGKRPEHVLQSDVEHSSQAIGTYVSRFIYLMEKSA